MDGRFIVIEGLDGSGKATQTELLRAYLTEKGENVIKLSFPDYESPSSALVRMYLGGELGESASSVNAYAAAAFYTVDRAASFLKYWKQDYENGAFILADRYAQSNIIYQMSKLPGDEWNSFIEFQQDFEYKKIGVPEPDAVIYLDVEPEVSQKLLLNRYKGDDAKKDLHEKDLSFLLSCRRSALYAAEKLGWRVISCTSGGNMRTVEEISADIIRLTEAIVC